MKSAQQKLIDMNACQEAVEWVGGKSIVSAWNRCTRPEWMLWVAAKIIDRKLVVLAACDCAETALQYAPKSEDRPRHAIETARALYAGKATIQDCRNAVDAAAYAAAYVAAAADDRKQANRTMCKLIRKRITAEQIKTALETEK